VNKKWKRYRGILLS